jgi:hypothetical protein
MLVLAVAAIVAGAAPVSSQVSSLGDLLRSFPSDDRATFVEGNVTTCAGAGFPGRIEMGSTSNTSASDSNVSGTVKTNAGSVQPGKGQEVNVALLKPNVTIDAVVVKGADGYNLYTNPAVLPPALQPDQHYIPPLTGSGPNGNVPTISHWFVCYHLTTPPGAGSLIVTKTVIPPVGPPVNPLPTSYSAVVNCTDPAHQNIPITFGEGGGAADPITGIALGSVCTVTETGPALPPGVVSYQPTGADNPGVTIAGATAITVQITNDFSGFTPQSGNLRLVKTVLPVPPGVTVPASYTARVLCLDGTDQNVTLPGTGGEGTPLLTVTAGTTCAVGEDIAGLPAGWVVSYSVDGQTPTSTPAVFTVTGNATVSVTITNDLGAVVAPPTSALIPPVTQTLPEPSPTAVLPPTGGTPARTTTPLLGGLALVALGALVVGYTTRRSRTDKTS